ncbi:MAG: RNA pyrophosphohydrolase [Leptospiraceae bacterium]|nr:RNA pyrophosphohydrolase [Leptospiraceae bacterium]
MSKEKPYRKNVGVVVFNSEGKVLTGERLQFPGAWQFPQGGVDKDEDERFAAERELYEEIGVKGGKIISEYPEWISYEFPKELEMKITQKYRGQIQKWYLYYWDEPIENCNLMIHEQEFSRVKFDIIEKATLEIVPFKKDVYEKIVSFFAPKISEFLDRNFHT